MSEIIVHLANPDFRASESFVKFTLTYAGGLRVSARKAADRKQALRKHFHKQLKRLWDVNPYLCNWRVPGNVNQLSMHVRDWVIDQMPSIGDYRFVPVITRSLHVECALEFRVLRPTDANTVSDIDNQIKILLDALKMPREREPLGGYSAPEEGETPFYVLAQDDSLFTKITSLNDELLEPLPGKESIEQNDVRMMVDVYVRPQMPNPLNTVFYSDSEPIWDHKYVDLDTANMSGMTNEQLRAVATQCVYRIEALSHALLPQRFSGVDQAAIIQRRESMHFIWLSSIRPKAVAIRDELNRRIFGEGPAPMQIGRSYLDTDLLAGRDPLGEAALEMRRLILRLE